MQEHGQERSQEREIHLLEYWGIVVKRRWVVYTALIVLVATVTLGSLLIRPQYTATTRLQIEPSAPNILPFQEIMASVPDQRNDFYQTQYGLIQSRRVAREVIASLRLENHPDFKVDAPGGDARAAKDEADAERIDLFLERLKVAPVRNSRLVDIQFRSHDRDLAAKAANRIAETYIAFINQADYNTSERATMSLAHQIANLSEEIDSKEKELQAYARANGIVALNEKQNITLKNLNDMSDSYTKAQAVRIEKEARYAALRDSVPGDIEEVLDSKLIQDLTAKSAELARRHADMSGRYKPDWPEMVRLRREMEETRTRLTTERQGIYDQVLGASESAYRAARNEEAFLRTALDRQKRETQEFGLKEIQYNNLRAEIANRRTTLEALVKRQSEASTSIGLGDLVASNVRIVDVAEVPSKPSSPKILLNIALSLLTGLALGVGLAFFFEYLDKSVKSPEDMFQAAALNSIGLIPLVRPDGGGRLRIVKANGRANARAGAARPGPRVELMTHEDPKSKVGEAFRELRTALLVSQPGGPPRFILIASTQPGEGKTAVALNLAIALAQIGRRVLLVDADMRRPRLHKLLAVSNERGLSTYLSASDEPWPEAMHTTVPGLDLVPSGPLPPNPADLLDSERFAKVQREFEAQGYDHVIFDSPPVLAVADPTIMVTRMDAALLVVHAGTTGKDALAHAVQRLRQVKARITGGILNQVDLDEQSYHYYGYSYRRYYGDEPAQKPAAAVTAGAGAGAGAGREAASHADGPPRRPNLGA